MKTTKFKIGDNATDKRQTHHFGEPKKPHTKIKHLLLGNILQMSLSIANNLCSGFFNTDKKYTYVDLFAGTGKFDDGSKGSPIIALDIMTNHLKNSNSNFDKLQIIATEKEEENVKTLEAIISKRMAEDEITNQIDFYSGAGNWELFDQKLKAQLKNSTWGFIFADPFSTELDVLKLVKMLKDCSKLKDILVFFNFNTLARQDGRRHINDVERICKNIGITENDLLDADGEFSDKFETTLREHFSGLKEFVVGVSFPTTVEGKLITADYFYLIFSTSSVMLVDFFLMTYELALIEFTGYQPQRSLFEGQDILDYVQNNNSRVSLFNLFIDFSRDFLSWKNIMKKSSRVPTVRNLLEIINEQIRAEQIKVNCDQKYIYKRKIKENKIGDIKINEIKKKADMNNIILEII